MRVLTVYAHPDPRSFCHAVLDRLTAGLPQIEGYLRRAYILGCDFAEPAAAAGARSPTDAGESDRR
jgi:NAD(P)H dehydrogenase (quinone)